MLYFVAEHLWKNLYSAKLRFQNQIFILINMLKYD
jgi:hypothetical protein